MEAIFKLSQHIGEQDALLMECRDMILFLHKESDYYFETAVGLILAKLKDI